MDGERDPFAILEFGRFKVVPHRRELIADGKPVTLGGRAFDTLLVLIHAGGSVIDKDVLMRRVWPDRTVEENNLQAQISALRKAFGDDRDLIRTVAGRGYQFTGEIRPSGARSSSAPRSNLPEPVSELIGRDASVRAVVELATTHRLVTLTGAGGIGKTRLGLEVARQLSPRFPDGVGLAELAPLTDPPAHPDHGRHRARSSARQRHPLGRECRDSAQRQARAGAAGQLRAPDRRGGAHGGRAPSGRVRTGAKTAL